MLLGVALPTVAHAQTTIRALPTSDTSACTRQHFSTHDIFCSAPAITTFCPGQQFFSTTDGHGNPTDWTFTDRNHHCVTVTFSLPSSFSSCDIELYVPNVFADAKFKYSWFNGITNTDIFNENPVDGWQHLFSATDATSLSFTDLQATGSQHLGWGSTSKDGVRITCG